MSTQRYSVTPQPIETVLAWVKSGEIAIPEIQRHCVWEPYYEAFLRKRRVLMAKKIQTWFLSL